MKNKKLFLLCGPSGSGKTTWIKKQIEMVNYPCLHISRDAVRMEFLKEEDKNIFAYEDDVFDEFCRRIEAAILDEDGADVIFVDATHLSEAARNRVLDRLTLDNVDIYAVAFNIPLEQILKQNECRKGSVRTYVPRSVIRRMFCQYQPPTENEKYKYKSILTVGFKGSEKVE